MVLKAHQQAEMEAWYISDSATGLCSMLSTWEWKKGKIVIDFENGTEILLYCWGNERVTECCSHTITLLSITLPFANILATVSLLAKFSILLVTFYTNFYVKHNV